MVHLYCGSGKGKTTCAMGLAVRAAGRGIPVCVAQFLKSEDSGERIALRRCPGITLLPLPERIPFSFRMDETERAQAVLQSQELLDRASAADCGMLVLDEICAAVSCGFVQEQQILRLLADRRERQEVVLTGRDPGQRLLESADYVTEMLEVRHPYTRGIPARRGIEY